jgi:hypothetical protein
MINEITGYLNNRFENYDYQYLIDVEFDYPAEILGDFSDTFLAGEWVKISGTRLNDGIYLIESISDTSMIVSIEYDRHINNEDETEDVLFIKCDIPKELADLALVIETYKGSAQAGLGAESQGGRAVTYKGDSSWQNVYAKDLSRWRRLRW